MKNEANWDLTDNCLGHCEALVDKLGDSHNLDTWRNPQSRQEFNQNPEGHTQSMFTRFHQGVHPEHGDEGGTSSSNPNSGLFVEATGFGAMADDTAFLELWQMPYLDA
jgi:hypothetical protein